MVAEGACGEGMPWGAGEAWPGGSAGARLAVGAVVAPAGELLVVLLMSDLLKKLLLLEGAVRKLLAVLVRAAAGAAEPERAGEAGYGRPGPVVRRPLGAMDPGAPQGAVEARGAERLPVRCAGS